MQDKNLVEHLEDFRKTLLHIVVIIFCSFFVTFYFGSFFSEFLLTPLRELFGPALSDVTGKIVYIGLLDKILSQFQISLWISIIISSPLWFYKIWAFIKPGLYDQEIKVIRPFIIIGFILFCLGVLFGHLIVFPALIKTFTNFGVEKVEATINLKDYLVLASKLLLLCGMVFQLPNIILVLGFAGIADDNLMKKNRRYVYAGFAILSGIITPPDVLTMMMLWIPLIVLFEIGIIASRLLVRPYKNRQ